MIEKPQAFEWYGLRLIADAGYSTFDLIEASEDKNRKDWSPDHTKSAVAATNL